MIVSHLELVELSLTYGCYRRIITIIPPHLASKFMDILKPTCPLSIQTILRLLQVLVDLVRLRLKVVKALDLVITPG